MNTQIELSEETQANIAVMKAALEGDSLKARLQKQIDGWKELYPNQPVPDVWRAPDTVIGILSKEKVQELLNVEPDEDQLFYRSGLSVISNGKAFFLSDDGNYGWNITHWTGVTFGNWHYNVGEGKNYRDLEHFIERHCKGERYIANVDELAKYLVTGE